MTAYLQLQAATENRWRAIILFGRNTASFKFALGEALLTLGRSADDLLRLDELALPYAKAIARHLTAAPKQITVPLRRVPPCDGPGKLNHGACPYGYPYGSPYDYPTRRGDYGSGEAAAVH
jgi:hypothetical protein